MRAELIPRAYLVTPNAAEAAALSGVPVRTLDDAREAAKRIAALGPRAVIVKGGHLDSADAIDIFYDGRDLIELRAERIQTRHTHGTGCTFSSAITANLALGLPLGEAVARAKTYLTEAIRRAPGLGRGHGPLGLP
jgi:hydroxymethylpyrimidine/phosphomethylpyrimidine kinase